MLPFKLSCFVYLKLVELPEVTFERNVYNGAKLIHAQDEFFMTDMNIIKILKNLKIKNCEGFDRIPLRVLNEGAERLVKPLSALFRLIYDQKTIPEQWKTAKIIPLHKKVPRMTSPITDLSLTYAPCPKSMKN